MKFIIIEDSLDITPNTKIYSTVSKNTPYTYKHSNDANERFIDDNGDVRPLSAFNFKKVNTVDWLNT